MGSAPRRSRSAMLCILTLLYFAAFTLSVKVVRWHGVDMADDVHVVLSCITESAAAVLEHCDKLLFAFHQDRISGRVDALSWKQYEEWCARYGAAAQSVQTWKQRLGDILEQTLIELDRIACMLHEQFIYDLRSEAVANTYRTLVANLLEQVRGDQNMARLVELSTQMLSPQSTG